MPRLVDDLNCSRGLLGLGEDPDGSNHNHITEWYAQRIGDAGFAHAPWCAMSRSYTYDVGAGGDLSYAYCPFIERDARAGVKGLVWLGGAPEVGAWMLIDFNHDGVADHIGQVEAVRQGGVVVTLEGNIGNGYRRQVRDGKYLRGFVRVPYDDAGPVPDPGPGNIPAASGHVDLPMVRRGSRGRAVRFVQMLASVTGGAPDGIFGPNTAAGVRQFQTDHALAADGVVGPRTWCALLQAALDYVEHAGLHIDGEYGPATTAAVIELQRRNGLAVDGVAGYATFGALTGQ